MSLETRITALGTAMATVINALTGNGKVASTGDVKASVRTTPETGWIFATGTIGDSSSGATTRANADCEALFHVLYQLGNAEAPVSGGRGASASADWAAHKTIAVPDLRSRGIIGRDDMGGSAANRVTSSGSGIDGATLGATGGVQNVTLTSAQSGMPAHTHSYADYYPVTAATRGTGGAVTATSLGEVARNTGAATAVNASAAHTNMPPSVVLNLFIKL